MVDDKGFEPLTQSAATAARVGQAIRDAQPIKPNKGK